MDINKQKKSIGNIFNKIIKLNRIRKSLKKRGLSTKYALNIYKSIKKGLKEQRNTIQQEQIMYDTSGNLIISDFIRSNWENADNVEVFTVLGISLYELINDPELIRLSLTTYTENLFSEKTAIVQSGNPIPIDQATAFLLTSPLNNTEAEVYSPSLYFQPNTTDELYIQLGQRGGDQATDNVNITFYNHSTDAEGNITKWELAEPSQDLIDQIIDIISDALNDRLGVIKQRVVSNSYKLKPKSQFFFGTSTNAGDSTGEYKVYNLDGTEFKPDWGDIDGRSIWSVGKGQILYYDANVPDNKNLSLVLKDKRTNKVLKRYVIFEDYTVQDEDVEFGWYWWQRYDPVEFLGQPFKLDGDNDRYIMTITRSGSAATGDLTKFPILFNIDKWEVTNVFSNLSSGGNWKAMLYDGEEHVYIQKILNPWVYKVNIKTYEYEKILGDSNATTVAYPSNIFGLTSTNLVYKTQDSAPDTGPGQLWAYNLDTKTTFFLGGSDVNKVLFGVTYPTANFVLAGFEDGTVIWRAITNNDARETYTLTPSLLEANSISEGETTLVPLLILDLIKDSSQFILTWVMYRNDPALDRVIIETYETTINRDTGTISTIRLKQQPTSMENISGGGYVKWLYAVKPVTNSTQIGRFIDYGLYRQWRAICIPYLDSQKGTLQPRDSITDFITSIYKYDEMQVSIEGPRKTQWIEKSNNAEAQFTDVGNNQFLTIDKNKILRLRTWEVGASTAGEVHQLDLNYNTSGPDNSKLFTFIGQPFQSEGDTSRYAVVSHWDPTVLRSYIRLLNIDTWVLSDNLGFPGATNEEFYSDFTYDGATGVYFTRSSSDGNVFHVPDIRDASVYSAVEDAAGTRISCKYIAGITTLGLIYQERAGTLRLWNPIDKSIAASSTEDAVVSAGVVLTWDKETGNNVFKNDWWSTDAPSISFGALNIKPTLVIDNDNYETIKWIGVDQTTGDTKLVVYDGVSIETSILSTVESEVTDTSVKYSNSELTYSGGKYYNTGLQIQSDNK